MEHYLTAQEVAEITGMSEGSIRRYVMNKEIPYHKIIRAVRFRPSEIEKWLDEKKMNAGEKRGGRNENKGQGLFPDLEAEGGAGSTAAGDEGASHE
jgi:excisionase family DNA binding protein